MEPAHESDAAEPQAPPHLDTPLVERLRALHLDMVGAVLAGGDGLVRVARLCSDGVGAPVAVVLPRLHACAVSADTIDPGPLRAYVAERVRGRPAPVPAGVSLEVPIASGDDVVGAVLLLGEARDPDAGEFLHLAAMASLTELAVAEARDEVEENLRGSFLEDLRRNCADLDARDVLRRAARLGCDLSGGAVALCAEPATDRPRHIAAIVAEEHPGALAQLGEDGRIHALLPGEATHARRLAERLRDHGPVGLSSYSTDPADAGRALEEAELVLDVVRRSGRAGGEVTEDIGSGTYRLLFRVLASHPEEVKSFYDDTIAPLVAYDEQYGSDLVGTLEAYLEHNCSTTAAASAIYVHRHTIGYRLDRIRELTGLDPAATEDRERLGLGLKALRIIAPRLHR